VLNTLKKKTNSSVILITHDLGVIAKYAERVIIIYAGKPVEFVSADDIFYKPLHPYTLGLIGLISKLNEEKKERLKSIKGRLQALLICPKAILLLQDVNLQ